MNQKLEKNRSNRKNIIRIDKFVMEQNNSLEQN